MTERGRYSHCTVEVRRSDGAAGILFWSWLWAVPGMLLAIPMTMVVKVVCDRVEGLQPIGNMLGG